MQARVSLVVSLLLFLAASAFGGETWKSVPLGLGDDPAANEIQFLKSGADGRVWIGTSTGLAVYRQGVSTPHAGKDGKPLAAGVWNVLEDTDGSLWIGTDRGILHDVKGVITTAVEPFTVARLARLDGKTLLAFAKHRGSERNVVMALGEGGWAPVPSLEKLRVADLFQMRSGKIWISVEGDGVLEISDTSSLAKPVHHAKGLNVTAMAEDGAGQLWCGLWERGVRVYDGKAWSAHLEKCKAAVTAICSDTTGAVWVATNAEGLYVREKDVWKNLLRDEGNISLLASTSDGRVWISSQMLGGLRVWNGKAFAVSLDSPMPIRCVIRTPAGGYAAGGVLDGLHVTGK